jgi:glycerophosphoryl diester phosphodiesterase
VRPGPVRRPRRWWALEEKLVPILRRNGLDHAEAPVFVQSFEAHNLQALHDDFRLRPG